MQNFYNRFLTGEAPQKALRTIQLEAIQSKEWQHPYYWAPFVMVGRE
ncbi:CHAT domain-containing protein, partial [bacterium]|nr:CHAT domain-containing protein [bacterium]